MHRPDHPTADELAELFREHANGLAGAVHGVLGPRADTQEILQEAFLKAWQSVHKGVVPDNAVAWLFVITMNLARDARRKKRRAGPSQPIEETNPMELKSVEPGPAHQLAQSETMQEARAAIHQLKPAEREVFLLRTAAGLSFDDAARALSIPVGTAKTRMRAALTQLRSKLKHLAPQQLAFNPATTHPNTENGGSPR